MTSLPSLSGQSWLTAKPLQRLLGVLSASGGEARVAGGAVRNALLGVPVADVDIATPLPPDKVTKQAEAAGMSVHPTGLAHGTVTVVIHDTGAQHAFEVTTLRVDTETDGRRATVAFTDDWHADAARRDFTINALYCDADGIVHDPLQGIDDIHARRVRFAGNPHDRIKEDFLRILRFFRFHASFGEGAMDKPALAACTEHRHSLASLSGERIRAELFKLLVAPGVIETISVMDRKEILQCAFPAEQHVDRLRHMCAIDLANDLAADEELRLAALVDPHRTSFERLRLSNQQSKRLKALPADASPAPALRQAERKIVLYQMGRQQFCDAVRYRWALSSDSADDAGWRSLLQLADDWPVPVFPITGGDLINRGIPPGRDMGKRLQTLEDWWVAAGFPGDKEEILAQLPD